PDPRGLNGGARHLAAAADQTVYAAAADPWHAALLCRGVLLPVACPEDPAGGHCLCDLVGLWHCADLGHWLDLAETGARPASGDRHRADPLGRAGDQPLLVGDAALGTKPPGAGSCYKIETIHRQNRAST